jgi:hypothetical protein
VLVTLSAQSVYRVVASTSAAATIADDDTASQIVSFYIDDPTAAEFGRDTGRFTIARDGSVAAPLTVAYTVGGTATAGKDYVPLAGSVTIPAGHSSAVIGLTPIDDRALEQIEIVILTLSPGPGYRVGAPASATVTIYDDDTTPPPSQAPGQQIYLPLVSRTP